MATKKEAEQRCYEFTGIYDFNKMDVKARQEKEFAGYKTLLVTEPPSKYSRSHNTGFSIYAEPKYFYDKRVRELEEKIASRGVREARAKEEYEKAIAEIESVISGAIVELAALKDGVK